MTLVSGLSSCKAPQQLARLWLQGRPRRGTGEARAGLSVGEEGRDAGRAEGALDVDEGVPPSPQKSTSFGSGTPDRPPSGRAALGTQSVLGLCAASGLRSAVFLDYLRFSELKHPVMSTKKNSPKDVLIQPLTLHLHTSFPERGSSCNP